MVTLIPDATLSPDWATALPAGVSRPDFVPVNLEKVAVCGHRAVFFSDSETYTVDFPRTSTGRAKCRNWWNWSKERRITPPVAVACAVNSLLKEVKDRLDAKEKAKAEVAAFNATEHFKAGDVLRYSWGHNMTTCEFFQVGAVGRKTVELIPLESSQVSYNAGCGQGRVTVAKDAAGNFIPVTAQRYGREAGTYRASPSGHGAYIKMPHGVATKWDGNPCYFSDMD